MIKVDPIAITDEDIKWLVHAAQECYTDCSAQEFVQQAMDKQVQLWRFETGIIVTSLTERHGQKELYIDALAGRHFIARLKEINGTLMSYARENQCKRICGLVRPGTLAETYIRKLGVKPLATIYAEEI